MPAYAAKLRDGTIHRFEAPSIEEARAHAKGSRWRHVIWVGVDGSRGPVKAPSKPKGNRPAKRR